MENHTFQFSQQNNRKANIVLVGFAGAGKSTVGKKLAGKLNYTFIDTDRYFEQRYRFTIVSFFQKFGEELFRRLEHQMLCEVLEFDNAVIATGGGTPCFFNNMDIINEKATSIYIEMSPKSLCDRLTHSKKPRPLTQNLSPEELQNYINTTLNERRLFYQKAHHTIRGENISIDEIISLLSTTNISQ